MARALKLLAAGLLALAGTGCATYPDYYYSDVYDDRGDYYYEPVRRPYHDHGWSLHYGWSPYYSALWPLYGYNGWPGYYYGVTWFPRRFGWGWGDWAWYHAYSPYRYSFWDNYYDWRAGDWRDRRPGGGPRFGSARNEAERLANMAPPPPVGAPGATDRAGRGSVGGQPYSRERDAYGPESQDASLQARRSADPAQWRRGRDAGWRADPRTDDEFSLGGAPPLRERAPFRDRYSVPGSDARAPDAYRLRDEGQGRASRETVYRERMNTWPQRGEDPRLRRGNDGAPRPLRRYEAPPQPYSRAPQRSEPSRSYAPQQRSEAPSRSYAPRSEAPSRSYSSPSRSETRGSIDRGGGRSRDRDD